MRARILSGSGKERGSLIPSPFTVLVDSREQSPYTFQGLRADADKKGLPIDVARIIKGLPSGDYSIKGLESRIAVERKSLSDLFSTLAGRREQFQAEHERLAEIVRAGGYAAVVVESSLAAALQGVSESRLNPKTVVRTSISWAMRYGVAWHWWENRRLCEVMTYRLLEKFWQQDQEKKGKEFAI